MVNLPSFRQLEHLVMLADHSHFGHAARACHVTQSTLSASIKELENVLEAEDWIARRRNRRDPYGQREVLPQRLVTNLARPGANLTGVSLVGTRPGPHEGGL